MSSYLELFGWVLPIKVGGACLPLLTTAYVSPMLGCESLWTKGTWDNIKEGYCKKEAAGQSVFMTLCKKHKLYYQ